MLYFLENGNLTNFIAISNACVFFYPLGLKKMENFNTYKVNELIEVYEFLKEKGQTTLAVLTAKDEIKKVIAAKLKIAKTDVVRLSKKKEEKK